jgi:cytochrome c-type biogenesis protein CcmH/NrfF
VLSGITYVTVVDLNELPTEPPEAKKVFKRACRFQVRDSVSITIQDWWLVPETTKEQLWRNITEKIKCPYSVDEEFVKSATLISMGRLFHR